MTLYLQCKTRYIKERSKMKSTSLNVYLKNLIKSRVIITGNTRTLIVVVHFTIL